MEDEYTVWHFRNENVESGYHVFYNLNNANAYNIGQIIEIINPKTFKLQKMKVSKIFETEDTKANKKAVIVHFEQQ